METLKTQVLVLGSGPGGYAAAFRAADLGMQVTLVERYKALGGVCLNVGCIPSKALLHVAKIQKEMAGAANIGLNYGDGRIDLSKIRSFKQDSVNKLTKGVAAMAEARKVRVVQGEGRFSSSHSLCIELDDGRSQTIEFEKAIIAAGSRSVQLPFMPEDPRIWDSTRALELSLVPKRLLVIGGGIIGLELGTVYQALGSDVSIVEAADQLIPAADKDLVDIYQRHNRGRFDVHLATRVTGVDASARELLVHMRNSGSGSFSRAFDAILVAVGRRPNGDKLDIEEAGTRLDARGFIPVNQQMQTEVPHIFAIGDIAGEPMLAHKAAHEGHLAAEIIAGQKQAFHPHAMPAIAYTSPEVAWVGLTEKQLVTGSINYMSAAFPWRFSGRAISAGYTDGSTKILYDPANGRLLGAGLVGENAGELLAELTLALEFGATVEDLALTVHAHPTLSETVGLAGQLAAGTITDLPRAGFRARYQPSGGYRRVDKSRTGSCHRLLADKLA